MQEAEYYCELASAPKQIAWYENCNHELSAQARLDRAIFLCEQLGLPNPSQHVLGLLERVDYEYERRGTCNLFVMVEPLAGWRHVEVTAQRTMQDYAKVVRLPGR